MKHSTILTVLAPLFLGACAGHQEAEPDAGDVLVRSLGNELVPAALDADVTLPLELYEDKYLFVQGVVNGTPTDIVVDSGAGITVVDRAFADALGLVGQGDVVARGVGGGRSVKLAGNVEITLGSLHLPPLTVAIIDLEEVHEKLGRRMPVILGKELFHAFPVTIDYAGRRVIVHDAEHFESPAGSIAVPARPVDQGHVMVEAQLEDLAPAWFVIDTGSGNTVDFHVPYVKSNDLLRRYPRQSELLIGGVGGSLTATVAVSSSFTLAGHVFRSVPVTLATADQGAFASGTSAGTIGAELLSRFVVTFDLPHERLFLQPGVALDAPFPKDRLGISCKDQDGHLVVEFIAPGSPAVAAGLVKGDELVAIDGVALEGRPLRDRLRQVAHEAAGTSVRIGLRGGTERVVMLADYF